MLEQLDQILSFLNKLQGLPAVALVFVSCIAVGYVWRAVRFTWFPNDAIPMAVMAWGALFMSFIADARANDMPLRIWIGRNILVGMVSGLAAWILHNYALSKIEDWLATKFPGLNNTAFFNKSDVKQQPIAKPTVEEPQQKGPP